MGGAEQDFEFSFDTELGMPHQIHGSAHPEQHGPHHGTFEAEWNRLDDAAPAIDHALAHHVQQEHRTRHPTRVQQRMGGREERIEAGVGAMTTGVHR